MATNSGPNNGDPPDETPVQPRRRGRPSRNDPRFIASRQRSTSSSSNRRSSTRRRLATSDDASMSTPAIDTPQTHGSSNSGGSIRDSARIQSVATGSQQSISHQGSMFHLNYRRQLQNQPNIDDTTDEANAILHATLPTQHQTSPIQATRLHNTNVNHFPNHRTCFCHDKTIPKDCTECELEAGSPCGKHILVQCSNQGCTKEFHILVSSR